VRPMNAKAGEPLTKVTKYSLPELLEVVRIWRKQTAPRIAPSRRIAPGSAAVRTGVLAGMNQKQA
jgi:hypothetical protein